MPISARTSRALATHLHYRHNFLTPRVVISTGYYAQHTKYWPSPRTIGKISEHHQNLSTVAPLCAKLRPAIRAASKRRETNLFRRARYQKGALQRVRRNKGPDVWVFRWYETQIDGIRVRRKAVLGTVEQYPSESSAQAAADALRININQESPRLRTDPISVETLWRHYVEYELPRKEYSTQLAYTNYAANWILPRWKSYRLEDVRTIGVEQWLNQLPMSGGSKGKIKCILSAIFSHAVRWELAERNPIAGQGSSNGKRGVSTGVRVSTKRQKIPIVLSVEQIRRLLELLPLRERTMILLDATTGLRISELVGLQWRDVDFQNLLIHVRHAWVLGRLKECKTEASHKPIPLAGC